MNIRSSIRVPVMLVLILTISVPLFLFSNQSTVLAQSADVVAESASGAEAADVLLADEIRGLILAAAPRVIFDGEKVTFIASVSNGTDIDWTWNFGDGSAPFTTSGTGQLSRVEHNFRLQDSNVSQTFRVSVTASNERNPIGVTVFEDVTVLVQKPVGLTVTHEANGGTAGVNYTFTASVQKGEGVTYDWDFGDGTVVKDGPAVIVHSYKQQNIYQLTVVAKNKGGQTSISQAISIRAAPPTFCRFNVTGNPWIGETLTFTPESDGTGITYYWNFDSGRDGGRVEASNSKTPITHIYNRDLTYTVTLACENISGRLQAPSRQISIIPVPPIKIPDRGINLTSSSPVTAQSAAGKRVVFAVESGNATQLTYIWDFGDGNHAITKKASTEHVYKDAGGYLASVTAYNSVSRDVARVGVHIDDAVNIQSEFGLQYRLANPPDTIVGPFAPTYPIVGETIQISIIGGGTSPGGILSHPNTSTAWNVSGTIIGRELSSGGRAAIPAIAEEAVEVVYAQAGSYVESVEIIHTINGVPFTIETLEIVVSIGEELVLPLIAR